MKILYFFMDYYYYLGYPAFRHELSKMEDVTLIHNTKKNRKVWDVKQLVKENNFDAVILGVHSINYQFVKNLSQINIVKVMMGDDPHSWLDKHVNFINANNVDLLLPMTIGFVNEYKSKIKHGCIVENFPPVVDTKIFRDYELPRKWDVYFSGFIGGKVYPFRQKLEDMLTNRSDIKACFRHGFDNPIENYAKELSQSKIIIFGNGIYDYYNMRVLHGWATKTLVMCPMPRGGEEVGLIPFHNFVPIDENDFLDKTKYYMNNIEERNKIIENGFNCVVNHTPKHRAIELLELLGNIERFK